MTERKVALVEVFAAPQGEGFNVGRPAVFVRLAGCPLACEFAPGVVCDTPYMKANLKVTINELFNTIIPPLLPPVDYPLPDERHERVMLIFTGGEPTASPQFNVLVERALKHTRPYFYVAVETNGGKWREGLHLVDWVSVSPKNDVPQTSKASSHNPHPRSPALAAAVIELMQWRETIHPDDRGGEYRYVIAGSDSPTPYYHPATRHYLSPAVVSDGSGEEWHKGFPGFVPGAVARCLEIIDADPRWRLSCQQHKFLGVR